MGRPLRHTTSRPSRAIRKGNIAARVGKGNIGPTSSTGYYNTISPTEVGKYIIYKVADAGQAPLSFCPSNDGEFIRLGVQAGGSVSTVSDTLQYFANDNNYLVASLINTTGSTDVNPYCKYDTLGNNPSPQNEWFNSIAILDNMTVDDKEHALSEFVAMRGAQTVRYGAPYSGTRIYEIDSSGNVTEIVTATSSPSNGNFTCTAGNRYVANKPVHFHVNANGDVMCPVSYYGKNWGWYYTRYMPQTVRFYCLEDQTTIRIFSNNTLLTTLTGDEGEIVSYTTPSSTPNYSATFFNIWSNNFIIMTGAGNSGDRAIGALAGDRVYRRNNEYERTIVNTSPDGTSTYTVTDSTHKVWALSIADGAGGDNEVGHPLDELSKNYTYGYYLDSYFIVSPYSNDITISSWDGSDWVEFSTHTLSGTVTSPATAQSGSQGGGTRFNNNTLWKFEGGNPFYIVINDDSSDEEALLGWNSGNADVFFL
jgi:hypothetical protein